MFDCDSHIAYKKSVGVLPLDSVGTLWGAHTPGGSAPSQRGRAREGYAIWVLEYKYWLGLPDQPVSTVETNQQPHREGQTNDNEDED